jgi:hypothetical protein
MLNGETLIPRGADAVVKLTDSKESRKLTGQRIHILSFLEVFPYGMEPEFQQSTPDSHFACVDENGDGSIARLPCLVDCGHRQCSCQASTPEILMDKALHFRSFTRWKQRSLFPRSKTSRALQSISSSSAVTRLPARINTAGATG